MPYEFIFQNNLIENPTQLSTHTTQRTTTSKTTKKKTQTTPNSNSHVA
jgi:hypothetical protein